jgi:hypothetical protein
MCYVLHDYPKKATSLKALLYLLLKEYTGSNVCYVLHASFAAHVA